MFTGLMVGTCEHGNEPSYSIKGGKIVDLINPIHIVTLISFKSILIICFQARNS